MTCRVFLFMSDDGQMGDDLKAFEQRKRREARERERAEREAAWAELFDDGPAPPPREEGPRRPDQCFGFGGLELRVYGQQTLWEVTDSDIMDVPLKKARAMHAFFRLGGEGKQLRITPGEAREIFSKLLADAGVLTRRGEKILSMIPDEAAAIDEELAPKALVYTWWSRWWAAIADTLPEDKEQP